MSPRPIRNPKLGAYVRKARQTAGLTLRELATRARLDYSMLSYIEAGQVDRPAPDKLIRLAAALGVEAEELLGRAGHLKRATLPEMPVYLRAKYGMSAEAVAEAEAFFAELHAKEGGRRAKRRR